MRLIRGAGHLRSESGLSQSLAEQEGEFLAARTSRPFGCSGGDQVEHLKDVIGFFSGEERWCTRGDLDPFRIEDFGLMDSIFRSGLHPEPTHGTKPTTTHIILQFFQFTNLIKLVTHIPRATAGRQEGCRATVFEHWD